MNDSTTIKLPSVCAHFELRYSPFTDTFPISTPFLPKSDEIVLERMLSLLGQGKSFSLVGEPGSGKSMLIKNLLNHIEQKAFRYAYIPYSGLKPIAILREICDKLSIDVTGRSSLLGKIHKAVARNKEAPYTVIILDEAHTLPSECLLELFSLTHDTVQRTASASIILSGHSVLEKTLSLDIHSAIRTRIVAKLHLRPLVEEEVESFIKFRLKLVKAPTDLFTKEAIKMIELDSKGNRRVIMNLCGNCMDLAVVRQEKRITDEIAREVCEQH